MDDSISRQAVLDAIDEISNEVADGYGFDYAKWREYFCELPPAEQKRGKWNRLDMDTLNCNKCGATFVLNQGSEKMHFCPNCGAKMEGTE